MNNNQNPDKPLPIIYVDEDPRNADWLRFRWHLPAYKSEEFMTHLRDLYPQFPTDEERLIHFRTLPIYEFAVEQGRIINDEWVDQPARKPNRRVKD